MRTCRRRLRRRRVLRYPLYIISTHCHIVRVTSCWGLFVQRCAFVFTHEPFPNPPLQRSYTYNSGCTTYIWRRPSRYPQCLRLLRDKVRHVAIIVIITITIIYKCYDIIFNNNIMFEFDFVNFVRPTTVSKL